MVVNLFIRKGFVLLSIALSAGSAQSVTIPFSPFMMDFEGVGNEAAIMDFYNGGVDSQGNSGMDYGVSFGSDGQGLVDRDAGGAGNFANEPSPSSIMFFLASSSILNYSPGFPTGFSFFYTTAFDSSVTLWDDLDATGNMLGEIPLTANNLANNCVGDPQGGPGDVLGQYCNFDMASLAFAGLARSIDFSAAVQQVGFDNMTFGSVSPFVDSFPVQPVTSVAEPKPIILLGIGVIAIGLARRKSKVIGCR